MQGDVNGDGYAEVIVGVPFAGAVGAGRAYLYMGRERLKKLASQKTDASPGYDPRLASAVLGIAVGCSRG
ncbi:MAG: FG-GAP repeat protein [Anaerolineales bacterium]|nr:FG-GAP repeat protein [Anaerolineales bacterium]